MRSPVRWPLHPAPIDGEALSSWMRRIAVSYQMSVPQLLEHGLGYGRQTEQQLDFAPQHDLLDLLIERTGIDQGRLRQMSLAGWTPWLIDSLEPEPDSFDIYVHQFSVLLRSGSRSSGARSWNPDCPWLPWKPQVPEQRACPRCLEDPNRQAMLLIWQLPLLLSCPEHGCTLQPCAGFLGDRLFWPSDNTVPQAVSDTVLAMDRRTHEAMTTGQVQLPGRPVHAAIWFRLLRTFLDEVSSKLSNWGKHAPDLRLIWSSCGHPVRAGKGWWRPFEFFPWPVQAKFLEAAAAAIHLLETGTVTGRGSHADLFLPTPDVEVGSGLSEKVDRWRLVRAEAEKALQAAREDPAQAQTLYRMLLYGCRTPESADRLRADLADTSIYVEDVCPVNTARVPSA